MADIMFLTLAEVIDIHSHQIVLYGGSPGIRDMNLLSSAAAMPSVSFGGEYLHADAFEMAAAYAYHIAQNHPSLDGNKRAALASALVFLELNGITITDPSGKLYHSMIAVASGALRKTELADVLRALHEQV